MATTDQPATITTLASFTGSSPVGGLTIDSSGDLFGATQSGGAGGQSAVFELAKTASGYAGAPTTLASFDGANGSYLQDLLIDANGDLFGTTEHGFFPPLGDGAIFEIAKTATGYAAAPTTLASFTGGAPFGLITDADGNLFGITKAYRGTVFEIAKTATGYAPTTLASFNGPDGAGPLGLTLDGNGNLFGTTDGLATTEVGGMLDSMLRGNSTVFEIAKTASGYAGAPTTLASFGDPYAGPNILSAPIIDGKGDLFGIAAYDTVFEVTKTANGYASTPDVLPSFNGALPSIADANGDLFGTTSAGGASGGGTVFEVTETASTLSGTNPPEPPDWGAFDVRDLTLGLDYSASPLANAFSDAWLPEDSVVVAARRPDAFLQSGAGSDILAAQAGGDNVFDDTGGAANFELGGSGQDAYLFDAGHDPVSWNTIVGFHAGDFAAVFGIGPQDVAANAADDLGAPGDTGLTLRMASESGGPAFVTLAGYGTGALASGTLATAFGTDPASGRDYMLLQAT